MKKNFLFCLLFLFTIRHVTAQNIINRYAAVTDICATILTLREQPGFSVGDSVLVIQMQGAEIRKNGNDASFGDITDIKGAGLYQFNRIAKIQGNKVWLAYTPLKGFDPNGKVQLIDVPFLGNPTMGHTTCKPWDGSIGGVLVFRAGIITLSGDLDVSGKGFRGGLVHHGGSSGDGNNEDYILPESAHDFSGQKGEGIHIREDGYARGADNCANGGGAGLIHNSGGGGGGHIGAGGEGGYYTDKQGLRGQGGTRTGYHSDRIFMGGGGGSGHDNEGHGANAGDGGGIIIIMAAEIHGNGNKIKANGADAASPTVVPGDDRNDHDGGSGGGAGGSVLIQLQNPQNSQVIAEASGGDGTTMRRDHGSGGGGGCGLIAVNQKPQFFLGQLRGGSQGDPGSNDDNRAKRGGSETPRLTLELFQAKSFEPPLFFAKKQSISECDGSATLQSSVSGGRGTVTYRLIRGGQEITKNTTGLFRNLTAGQYSIIANDECTEVTTNLEAVTYPPLSSSNRFVQPMRCDSLGSYFIAIAGGKLPLRFQLRGRPGWQTTSHFEHLNPGMYHFIAEDARGCSIPDSFEIEDLSAPLNVTIHPDSSIIKILKGDTLRLRATTDAPYRIIGQYAWDAGFGLSSRTDSMPLYQLNESQTILLTLRDQFGCEGTDEVSIIAIQDTIYYFPNVISIPSENPENGLFVPMRGKGDVTVVLFQVFDRWGNMVFQRENFAAGDTSFAWDGTVNGATAPPGVYIYLVTLKFRDGTMKILAGDMTLIR